MTHIMFHFVALLITSFNLALAQWQGSGLHYAPQRLVWTKQDQFDWLWSEPNYEPVLKLPNTPLERCNRLCWESDYQYTYWMANTQNCICSNKYTWAYEVNVAPNPSFDQDIFPRFTVLNANFQALPCISQTSEISYHNSSTGYDIEDCIASCGDPTTQRPNVYTLAQPTLVQLAPDYVTSGYECQCFEVPQLENGRTCTYEVYHQYGRVLGA